MRSSVVLAAMVGGLLTAAGLSAVAATDATVVERPIKTGAFTGVILAGAMDVTIIQGKTTRVVAKGTEAALAELETEVKDGALRLKQRSDRTLTRRTGLSIAITVPDLKQVTLSGSGDVVISGMTLDALALDVAGAGDIMASGTCNTLEVDVAGAGDIQASKLKCHAVSASVAGAGDISVHADRSVRARIAGVGDIEVYGNPKERDVRRLGIGDVTYRTATN